MRKQMDRVRSPPRPKTRDRETEENRHSHGHRFSGRVGSEPEGSRPSGSIQSKEHNLRYDEENDAHSRKLSEFNEALPRGESLSMKFRWDSLLGEKPVNANADSGMKCVGGYVNYISKINAEKRHQGFGFSDLGVVPKSISKENDRERTFSICPTDVGNTKNDGYIDGTLPWRSYRLGLQKNDDFQFSNHPHLDKPSARSSCKEKENPIFNSRNASHYVIPTSQNKTRGTPSSGSVKNNDLFIPWDGINRSRGMAADRICHGGYGQSSISTSPANSELRTTELANYRRAHPYPTDDMDGDHVYTETRRSGEFSYRKMASVRARHSIVDSLVDIIDGTDSSARDDIRESRIPDHHPALEEESLDIARASHAMEQDSSGSTCLRYEADVCLDRERLQLEEYYVYQSNGGPGSYEDGLKRLPESEHDEGVYETEGSPLHVLTAAVLGVEDPSIKMVKRKRIEDMIMNRDNPKSKLSRYWNASDEIHGPSYGDEQLTDENIYQLSLLNNSGFKHFQDRRDRRTLGETGSRNNAKSHDDLLLCLDSQVSMQGQSSKPVKPFSRDIKKRLGPAQNVRVSCPSLKIYNYKQKKFLGRNLDNFNEGFHVHGGDFSEVKAKLAKTEPENSEVFKQLVHSAFLKFVKVLNDNPAQRRKYTEQGGRGTLKCSVCGSNSKEFVDTLGLVMHAFMSTMVKSRAQHLGFHKALCVLMGWSSTVAPNSSWVQKILPDAEALALKEDLIIWPPVVVLHNSSIANTNPDKRILVSVEGLRAVLRGMGFGRKMTKVCRGKPANQSIMVVSFHGTFSGFQEAERIHKLYVENKHGRTEFQQVNYNSSNNDGTVDKIESVLYGYLGIAGDLDKLDFETKKRCVVKSKKEILAIADDLLETQ